LIKNIENIADKVFIYEQYKDKLRDIIDHINNDKVYIRQYKDELKRIFHVKRWQKNIKDDNIFNY